MIKTEIFHTITPDFEKKWHLLWKESRQAHYFNSPVWFIACQATFNYPEVLLITSWEDSKLVGILPLVRTKKLGAITYASPGNQYYDKSSLLALSLDKSLLDSLFNVLFSLDSFYLSEVDENILMYLKDSNFNYKYHRSSKGYFLDLNSDPFANNHSKRIRQILKSISPASNNEFELKFIQGNTAENIKIASEIESQSNKKVLFKEFILDPVTQKLYRELSKLDDKNIIFSFLFYRGEPISYKIILRYNNTAINTGTSYKTSFKKLSPGKTLMAMTIRKMREFGFTQVDFSRGDNLSKRQFNPTPYTLYSIYYNHNRLASTEWIAYNHLFYLLESNEKMFEFIRKSKRRLSSI